MEGLCDLNDFPARRDPQCTRLTSASTARPSNASVRSHDLGAGDRVWTPCTRNGYRKSTIVGVVDDSFLVENEDEIEPRAGRQSVLRGDVRPFYDYGPTTTWADNTEMVHLDEANILENLRRRFMQDLPYTYTANVLLAVNPYKQIPGLYSVEQVEAYRGKNIGSLPPHPYAIADRAYRQMQREERNQALVISGESGAGKTETAKVAMHYITQISRTGQEHGEKIQDKIISSSPILESFGNASTVRNMNSSRFGKYNTMHFNRVGHLKFAGIQTYLLEASRVVRQQPRERNFHVFYEMLAGLDDDTKVDLLLDSSMRYRLLYGEDAKPSDPDSPEQQRESAKFDELKAALSVFVLTETQASFWEVLAALIHLGEIQFIDPSGDTTPPDGSDDVSPLRSSSKGTSSWTASPVPPSSVPSASPQSDAHQGDPATDEARVKISSASIDNLMNAADLLGVSGAQLESALAWKERKVNGTSSFSQRTKTQAEQTLQSIIKILYKRLFDHIVVKINESSQAGHTEAFGNDLSGKVNSMGTLDIYGFERLQTNSFEQLCINLANERLQQFFIEEVLSAEQRTYECEGLNVCRWELPDNTPVVGGIHSIMKILNDHSLRLIKDLLNRKEDKDAKFCENVHQEHIRDGRGSGPIVALRFDAAAARAGRAPKRYDGFQIRHYAGDVSYATAGWIDKNSDSLVPEVEALLSEATKDLTRTLSDKSSIDAKKTVNSVSSKYLGSLQDLLTTLKECTVHYIRCFNPNDRRQPALFSQKYVLDQVIQCGTVELVRIMHGGFPNRCNLKDLRRRFATLLPEDLQHYDDRNFISGIMEAFKIPKKDWTVGVTQLFMKAGQLRMLESLRDQGSTADEDMVREIKRHFAKKKIRSAVNAVKLTNYLKKCRKTRVHQGLQRVARLYVRLSRWLRAVRRRMHAQRSEAVREEPSPQEDVSPAASSASTTQSPQAFLASLQMRCKRPCAMPTNGYSTQLFMALNSEEDGQYATFLQSDINMSHPIGEDILKLWQRNMTESVLYHDGRQVISARLSSTPFQRVPTGGASACVVGGLDDLRRVDCHETGRAFPVSTPQAASDVIPVVTCMCQHKVDRQLFAACDTQNRVSIFWWAGTDPSDHDRPALRMMGGLCPRFEKDTSIYHMTFLSAEVVPRRISDKGGRVLVLLTHKRSSKWMSIEVMAVYAARFSLECIQPVQIETSIPEPGEAEVTFFTASHSERILMIGGRGMLQFWQVCDTQTGQIELQLIENVALTFRDIKNSVMVSVLSTPPPLLHGMQDWVMVGSSDGQIYGWKFDRKDEYTIQLNQDVSGRFRYNNHTRDVPIRCLIGTYGNSPDAHHRHVQSLGLPYSLFLNRVHMDDRSFYSLGEDGMLLAWSLVEGEGWTRVMEVNIIGGSPNHGLRVACHSSRLAPHLMLIADKAHTTLRCFNRMASDETPEEVVCYAG